MAENDDGDLAIDRLELLQCSKHENGCLSMSRLGLAEHVHP